MAITYKIDNADLLSNKVAAGTARPRDCTRGTLIVFTKPSTTYDNAPIEPGTYRIVDRKNFRGGYQTAEKVA